MMNTLNRSLTSTSFALLLSAGMIFPLSACRSDVQGDDDPFDLSDAQDMRPDADPALDQGALDLSMRPDLAPALDMAPDVAPDLSTDEDMAPDMLPDLSFDMPPNMPLRQLVSRDLMGDMPLENYVKDPNFISLNQEYSWIVQSGNSQQQSFLEAYRHVPTLAPMHAAAMRVPKTSAGNPNAVTIYGEVLLHTGKRYQMSIWVGRKGISLGTPSPAPRVTVFAMNETNFRDYFGVALTPDASSTVTLDGIRWTRFSADVEHLIGYGYFIIDDTSPQDLYLHAPMAIAQVSSPSAALAPPFPMEALTPDRSERLQEVIERVRRKRSEPPQAREMQNPTPYPF